MKKAHCWPQGHWNWPITVTHKHGVRCGEMVWVGGQVDLTPEGVVLNQGDLETQTASVMRNFGAVLEGLDCDLQDLVFLLCFYVNDGSIDEADFLNMMAASLPEGTNTTVNAVPVPYLAYEGMRVEIEGYAMRRENGVRTARIYAVNEEASFLPGKFCQALRSGKMIFVSGQYPIDASATCWSRVTSWLKPMWRWLRSTSCCRSSGAGFNDVVKNNRWYSGGAGVEDFEPAALACGSHYEEPGPAATGGAGAASRASRCGHQAFQRRDAGRRRCSSAPKTRLAGYFMGLARAPSLQARSQMRGDGFPRWSGIVG